MSYEPTNWKAGDVVTSAKLNKLEQGVADAGGGGCVVVATASYDSQTQSVTLDKTYNDIKTAVVQGKVVMVYSNMSTEEADFITCPNVDKVFVENGSYNVTDTSGQQYSSSDPDDYVNYTVTA